MGALIRTITLSTLLGCASAGGGAIVGTNAGPPPLKFEPALPPRFSPPIVEIDALDSWREADERLVMIDGRDVWALSRWTFLGETDLETAQKIGTGHVSAGVEATTALLEKLGLAVPANRSLKGPKLRATQLGERRVHWLWVCDEGCLKGLFADLGAPYDRENVRQAYVDRWQEDSIKAANAAALAALDKRFLDVDPNAWHEGGPWWSNVTTAIVPYIDGESVLVATATDNTASSDIRRAKAQEAARVNLARFFGTQVKGQRALTEAELGAMIQFARVTVLERRGSASALAICDQLCVRNSEAALGIGLPSDSSAARE